MDNVALSLKDHRFPLPEKILQDQFHHSMKSCEILCIGSSIVDHIIFVSDEWLREIGVEIGLEKGGVLSIPSDTFESILECLIQLPHSNPPMTKAGGSAGTTVKGLGQLGCRAGFLSRAGSDGKGQFIRSILSRKGVTVYGPLLPGKTAQVLCAITPDGERTFLFCGDEINGTPKVDDLDESLIKAAKIVHIEGYTVRNKKLLTTIIELAHKHNTKISMDLGAFVLVRENRDFLKKSILDNIDILFGNADEMRALFGSNQAVDQALKKLPCLSFAMKGSKGGSLYWKGAVSHFSANEITVVDTSGAGDLFISGLLGGILQNMTLEQCVALATHIGGLIVSVVGPELTKDQWNQIKKEFNL